NFLLGVDYHECADWQKLSEFGNISVVDRNAAGGPIHTTLVEHRLVGAVDANPAARPCLDRDFMGAAEFLKLREVDRIRVVERQEPSKPLARVPVDDEI